MKRDSFLIKERYNCRTESMSGTGANSLHVELSGFSVVIAATSNNPTILNPDFLRHNGIVSKNLKTSEDPPPISTPAFSQIAFEDGFRLRADSARILFEQFASSLTEENIICADIAKNYIKTVPHVPYNAIGINLDGHRVLQEREAVSNALIDKGTWMKFKTVAPDFQLKAVYELDDKAVTLHIKEDFIQKENGPEIPAIMFKANIHRDITETNQQMRINSLLSILDSWNGDLSDFFSLVQNFNSKNNI